MKTREGPRTVRFVASDEDHGKRLDQVLAARVPELSRRLARVVIDIGGVFIDGARTKVAGRSVRRGQRIEVHLGGVLERATKDVGRTARSKDAEGLPPYRIVFEDEDLLVVDKPAGLLTAPTPESDRGNLADLLSRREGKSSVSVVHRIDLQTSGLLVFAKTARANAGLMEAFRVHDIDREYVALVRGAFPDAIGVSAEPVRGKRAVTHFRVVERFGALATELRCRLETGRTHQIRLHCRHLGYPILGDPVHGERTGFDPPRMALHAMRLGFAHPRSGERLVFESPLPDELAGYRDELRSRSAASSVVAQGGEGDVEDGSAR